MVEPSRRARRWLSLGGRGLVRTRADDRWKAVFELAPVAMMEHDLGGTILAGNPALAELAGRPLSQLVGLSWYDLVHPDDRERLRDRVAARAAGERGSGPGLEVRLLRPDSTERYVKAHGSLLSLDRSGRGRVLLHISEITAERQRRDWLEEAQAHFSALVEHGSDIIAVLGRDLALKYASPAYRRVLGTDPAADLGHFVTQRAHPDDASRLEAALRAVASTPFGVTTLLARLSHASAGWRTLELTASNHLDDPVVAGLVCNARDVTERAEAAERMAYLAHHDALTGLANRALLLERLSKALSAEPAGARSAVLFFDLDGFKEVNDELGHAIGDRVLAAVAKRLLGSVRPGDLVARLGGDEFVVLAERVGTPRAAIRIADRARQAVSRPLDAGGRNVVVGCSIGIAFSTTVGPEELLDEADLALYGAKAEGGNRWRIFDPSMARPRREPAPANAT
jgi:diguanylate cyclase (GGDEF)-like protein/PAS domain S-box-containing protein